MRKIMIMVVIFFCIALDANKDLYDKYLFLLPYPNFNSNIFHPTLNTEQWTVSYISFN